MLYRIYTLTDPRDNQIRYVGQTKNELKHRLNQHIQGRYKCNNPNKLAWIEELRALKLRPVIQEIEQVEAEYLSLSEEFWVNQFILSGAKLLNIAKGGLGRPATFSDETRAKMSASSKGKPKSDEMKRKVAFNNSIRVIGQEARDKMGSASRKMWQNPEFRKKAIENRKAIPTIWTEEHRVAASIRAKEIWENPQTREQISQQRRGEHNSQARLNWDKVRTIRQYLAEGLTVNELADMYQVHIETIRHIKSNRNWKE